VLDAHESYTTGLESFSASGDLTVSDRRAGKAHTIDVRVAARRGGRLYLKGSVAVVTAIELVSDGERVTFRVPRKKKVWTGAADATPPAEAGAGDSGEEEDESAPYESLRPSDLLRALLPEPLVPTADQGVVLEADERSFSLALVQLEGGRGRVLRRVWLDRETLELSRARHFDETGDLESESRFVAWKDGWPQRVSISRPGEGFAASFVFTSFKPNANVPDKAFVPIIPDDYAVVEID
jgi:hypothetical protein